MSVRVNKLLMSYKITIAEALERSALKPLVRKVQIYCCFLSDKKDKGFFFSTKSEIHVVIQISSVCCVNSSSDSLLKIILRRTFVVNICQRMCPNNLSSTNNDFS